MSASVYSTGSLWIDNLPQLEVENYNLTIDDALIDVNTIGKGYAGVKRGPSKIEISVTSEVPATGFEWISGKTGDTTARPVVFFTSSGSTLAGDFFVHRKVISESTTASMKIQFTLKGTGNFVE